MGETCLMVLLRIEEHAEGPSKPLGLFLRQVTPCDHIFDDFHLLRLDSQEEKAKWYIICHHVFDSYFSACNALDNIIRMRHHHMELDKY